MKPEAKRRYQLNSNYVAKVKEENDKLLRVGFIQPVKQTTWLNPVVVIQRSGRANYRKLNVKTVTDTFSLPFTDGVLDEVARHEVYSFLDRFNGYNQIQMHPVDQEKMVFVTECILVFLVVVMMFGIKTTPTNI